MKEKLIIRNFGPIKNVELELGRFNVLIGEQATGKSTVAKVLAVCRYFSYIIDSDILNVPMGEYSHFEQGLNARGLREFIKNETYIFYQCNHYCLTVNVKFEIETEFDEETGKSFEIEFPVFYQELKPLTDEFKNLLEELDALKLNESTGSGRLRRYRVIPTSFFVNDVAAVLDNPFYIPTERGLQSIFSLGKESVINISNSLFNYFADVDDVSREFTNETNIEPLNIIYKNENGKHFIKSEKHVFLSLSNAASGYQSTIPIVLLIKYYTELKKKSKTFIIEEPELNLFPSAQNEMMKFLGDKIMNYGNSIFLTTHSPYILMSLNNLMYAHKIGQKHPEEMGNLVENNNLVESKYWVNPKNVSAYMMLPDGTCDSIIDKDGMIRVSKIDGISAVLNKEFNNVMDVELNITHEETN